VVAVVDDDEAVRRALARLIRSLGFEAQAFATGDEFLSSLARREPDCLILDLHMPHLSGFEVQERLAQAGVRVPIIVLTGHHSPEGERRVRGAGAAAYLRKPVDDAVLRDTIAGVVRGGEGDSRRGTSSTN
jgi:FixJ family two-component response regulator